MFNGLHDIDWARLSHAYGSAEEVPDLLAALASPDEQERADALDHYYSAVLHQGSIYSATTATLPFLIELVSDPAVPGRAAIVELLVSIGREAADYEAYGFAGGDVSDSLALLRRRADVFVRFASDDDADRLLRQAAIPALGLLVDDVPRAVAVLRERLPAEPGVVERLLLVEAMATLVLRRPEAVGEATAWLTALADDEALDTTTRLAALVHRTRCATEPGGGEVTAAIGLLRREAAPADGWWASPRPVQEKPPIEPGSAPGYVIAAFEELERHSVVHSPTTRLLRTFHQVLDARVVDRTALLAEQLRSPDPGARLDALRMTAELVTSWRGDHGSLIGMVAERLADPHPEVVAEAAAVLGTCHAVADPAREALAALVAAQRAEFGPEVWSSPQPHRRRAHQEAVLALAHLGDERARPGLLTALDSGADAWRAVGVARHLPSAAGTLAPRLAKMLRGFDLATQWSDTEVGSVLAALGALGDTAALPAITEVLDAAVREKQWRTASTALQNLRRFGPAAAGAGTGAGADSGWGSGTLARIRALTTAAEADPSVVAAALAALWAVGGDPAEVLPLLLPALDATGPFQVNEAADVLGGIGPAAAAALPRLRALLADDYDWVRVHCAAALWEIGGEPEAPAVLGALLPAWERNSATGGHVAACLERMGAAAAPALPLLRAQLELPRRGGRFGTIEEDEKLQRQCRALLARLDAAGVTSAGVTPAGLPV
ncbi:MULTISPECIES: HEAT repeat domain-containing protein [unclassified Kitasatospora]|uniref:HEAT repeat domain-containing protein n=1 Tax=unclassified Kitasatospora TaxID=2633591 RepID=UPI0033EAE432